MRRSTRLYGAVLTGVLFGSGSVHAQSDTLSGAEYSAVIKAPDAAVLSSRMDGMVKSITVREGDSFRAGDVLVELDCTLQQAQMEKVTAQHAYAEKDYGSNKALARLNSASKLQLAASESATRQAAADLATATHQADLCTIKAPFPGVVVKRHANAFEVVTAQTQLLEIVNNDSLIVEFLAPSSKLTSLVTGLAFRVAISETGKQYSATIDRVVPQIDPVSLTVKVISKLERNDPVLWSGMSGWAKMP